MTPLLGRGTLGGGGAWGTLSSYCSPRKHLDALFFGVRGYKLIDAVSGKLFRTGDRCQTKTRIYATPYPTYKKCIPQVLEKGIHTGRALWGTHAQDAS